jgi:phospholipid/cholesterol/gamma-HCH transport system substrate-binding protein
MGSPSVLLAVGHVVVREGVGKVRRLALLLVSAVFTTSCAALGLAGACDGTEVIGRFEQVGDLPRAANVQSADVAIGSVTDIQLDKENWIANVTMCLTADEQIPADLEAVIRTTSLLGEKFVDLRPRRIAGPYLEDGDVIDVEKTSKATELEDVFAKLAAILGTGNLEQVNRFTTAQASILRDHSDDLREVLSKLRTFTGTLANRKEDIAAAVDNLDAAARLVLDDSEILRRFLNSFSSSSEVLADQRDALQRLLRSLDRFSMVSVRLIDATEEGTDRTFRRLVPVLRTLVSNSENVAETLRTLATFTEWFPETMPGDYLQLDVCQALETEDGPYYGPGDTCPQAEGNDDPTASQMGAAANGLELILTEPLRRGQGR